MAAEHEALLEAVCSAPDDDGPRLRFADWLEETGSPANVARAEFIRLQCALARLDEDADDELPLRRRAEALLRDHWRDWFRPLCAALGEPSPDPRPVQPRRGWFGWRRLEEPTPPYVVEGAQIQATGGASLQQAVFRRGFLEEATLRREERVDSFYLRRLTELTPVRRLTLGEGYLGPPWSWLEGPHCERLRALDIYFDFSAGEERETARQVLAEVCDSPHLPRLSVLKLRWVPFTAEMLRPLLDAPLLSRLTELGLDADASAVRALIGSAACANLIGLDLSSISPEFAVPETFASLAESPHLSRLRRLRIASPAVYADSVCRLTGATWFGRLTELHLAGEWFPGAFAHLLAALPTGLRVLALPGGGIEDAEVQAIAECPHLSSLRRLDLSMCAIQEAGALALARSPYLENLRSLDLRGNHFGDRGRAVLRERFGERVDLSPTDFP